MTNDSAGRVMAIVGAGHVGGRAAQTLRERGWQGRIVMIGMESHWPYERPPISKQLLTGEREAVHCLLRAEDEWRRDRIERIVDRVVQIDSYKREISLANGSAIGYEALLLATGGHVRRLTIPGADLEGVHTLRTLDDAARVAPRFVSGSRVAIVGGGFIGLEAAASARARGCEVCVLEGASRLLGRVVPETIAARVQRLHERNNVQVFLNVAPSAIERMRDGSLSVILTNDENIQADTVLVGIGIDPADELARAAGLVVDRGIVVNETLETSAPHIYAAGDVAIFPSRFSGRPIRQETWHNAQTQACIAARNMLGEREPYREVPWFWSDQYDHQLQVAGEPSLGTRTVKREAGSIEFYIDANGVLIGASGFGTVSDIAKDMKVVRMLIERGAKPEENALADSNIKLKSLL